MAEAAGDATPDRMQRLLNKSAWDPDADRDDLFAYVTEHLGHDDGVLIVDETGFLKKGINWELYLPRRWRDDPARTAPRVIALTPPPRPRMW